MVALLLLSEKISRYEIHCKVYQEFSRMDDLKKYEINIHSLNSFIGSTFLLSNYIVQFGVHIIACYRPASAALCNVL